MTADYILHTHRILQTKALRGGGWLMTADYILHSHRILQTKALRGGGSLMETILYC